MEGKEEGSVTDALRFYFYFSLFPQWHEGRVFGFCLECASQIRSPTELALMGKAIWRAAPAALPPAGRGNNERDPQLPLYKRMPKKKIGAVRARYMPEEGET